MAAHQLHDPWKKLSKRVRGVVDDAVALARGNRRGIPETIAGHLLPAMEEAAMHAGVTRQDVRSAVQRWLTQ